MAADQTVAVLVMTVVLNAYQECLGLVSAAMEAPVASVARYYTISMVIVLKYDDRLELVQY